MTRPSSDTSSGFDTGRPWVVVGAGRVGTMLGMAAADFDIPLRATWNRTEASAGRAAETLSAEDSLYGPLEAAVDDDLFADAAIWLTVVDDALEEVAKTLAPYIPDNAFVFHTAGSLGAEVLRDAGIEASVASVHPLLAVTDEPRVALEKMADVTWTLEGDPEAMEYARGFLKSRGADPVELEPGARALYHASAVTAANLLVALLEAATTIAEQAGLTNEEAREMLLPLAHSSLGNVDEMSPREALTGPVARGDDGTIERHMEALAGLDDPQLRELYDVLTARARTLAESDDD